MHGVSEGLAWLFMRITYLEGVDFLSSACIFVRVLIFVVVDRSLHITKFSLCT